MRTIRARRGNVAIIVALLMVVILFVGALAIDIGYARLVRVELQNAADAGAHAGVRYLDATDEGVEAAITAAVEVANANRAAGTGVAIDADDVTTGAWDFETGTFTESSDGAEVNAVIVEPDVPELALFVGPTVGYETLAVRASSVAAADMSGASATHCFIPLAIPACLIGFHGGVSSLQDVTLQINPPSIDSVGWARPNENANAAWSKAQINECTYSGRVDIGDPVYLQEGVAQDVLTTLASALENSTTSWSTELWGTMPARMASSAVSNSKYGRTYEGIVMVFDGGESFCQGTGGSFNGNYPLAGFMWGSIYDIRTSGGSKDRTIKMRLDVTGTRGNAGGSIGGGPDYGVTAFDAPRIVR